jgi:hypothetical protein
MVSVEELIGKLLLRHNCVIIPSFGGFVAKQTGASIDYNNGVMSPPKKSLLFNRQLINNDGLLIAELAVSNAIDYNESTKVVRDLIESWNLQLRRGERITIDKVGFLFFDQEKNICFEQDRFFNLLLDSYGLGKVHFLSESDVQFAQKTIIESAINNEGIDQSKSAIVFNTESISINKEEKETVVIQHPALKSNQKVWKYIAAACLLPIAFYSFWLPVQTNVLESGMISIKDFNPFYHSENGKYTQQELKDSEMKNESKTVNEAIAELPEDVAVFSYQYNEDLYIPIRIHRNAINNSTIQINSTENNSSLGNFEFIVGCFESQENANNLVSLLKEKGLNAYITDVSNGLSRISAGKASTEQELQSVIQDAKMHGFDGWVLKK